MGHLLLFLLAVSLFGLIQITASPAPGGDRGVGYAFMLILCGGGFVVFSGLFLWYVARQGVFEWLPVSASLRPLLVLGGWFAFVSTVFFSGAFRSEWHAGEFPRLLKVLADSWAVAWLPVLVLVPLAVWMHHPVSASPAYWSKVMFSSGMFICGMMGLLLLAGWARASAARNRAIQEERTERDKNQHQHYIDKIEAFQPTDPLVNILALTGRFHDADVRNAAVEKVKSRPDWEQEMMRLLSETEWDSEVYQFIDGNAVPHPELFVAPLKRSMHRIASEIKHRIEGANDLQPWHFEHFGIERLLRAIDAQFSKVPGEDFRPAVLELRQALDTPRPERFKDVQFTVTPVLDAWLKKH